MPTHCTFTTAFALKRVFSISLSSHTSVPRNLPIRVSTIQLESKRNYVFRPRPPKPEVTPRRLPADDQIRAPRIHVVQPDGKLSPPQSPRYVLNGLDRTTQSLVTVTEPGRYPAPGSPEYPVCRIINKKEELAAGKKKSKPAANTIVKTLEINWAIDAHDLGHRLKKLEEFLAKGNKIEVKLAANRRRNRRQATPEEAQEVLGKIRGVLQDEEGLERNGWKETQKMIGALGSHATLFFEGKAVEKKEKDDVEDVA